MFVFAVVKPLVADGSAKSHELSLAYDEVSLSKLDPPLVLQEFVNHGYLFLTLNLPGFHFQYTQLIFPLS